jgi:hypothetical protein
VVLNALIKCPRYMRIRKYDLSPGKTTVKKEKKGST